MVDSSMIIPTYTVFVRHSGDCKDQNKGRDFERCGCRKWISVYDPRITDPKERQTHFTDAKGVKQRSPFSAKTRVWSEAVSIAQALHDSHDPDKQRAAKAEAELKAIQAEKESQSATIEHAVSAFLIWKEKNPLRRSSSLSGKAATSTMINWRSLLGNVDAQGKVLRKGHLFTWLDNVTPRPVLISDLTPVLVDAFWAFLEDGKGDLTNHKVFHNLRAFFDYCRDRGKWIETNPMDGLKPPSVQDGNRTGALSDKQYQSILNVLADREQTADTKRLLTFIELMRWGGMAIHDAVNFHRDTLKGNELRYRRQKTNRLAKPNLVAHVVDLIRDVVPINGDPNQPFRKNPHRDIKGDKDFWRDQINDTRRAEAGPAYTNCESHTEAEIIDR